MLKHLDLKNWSYRGCKLAPPWLILWRGAWWFPLYFFLALACACAWLGFGRAAAEQLWNGGR